MLLGGPTHPGLPSGPHPAGVRRPRTLVPCPRTPVPCPRPSSVTSPLNTSPTARPSMPCWEPELDGNKAESTWSVSATGAARSQPPRPETRDGAPTPPSCPPAPCWLMLEGPPKRLHPCLLGGKNKLHLNPQDGAQHRFPTVPNRSGSPCPAKGFPLGPHTHVCPRAKGALTTAHLYQEGKTSEKQEMLGVLLLAFCTPQL